MALWSRNNSLVKDWVGLKLPQKYSNSQQNCQIQDWALVENHLYFQTGGKKIKSLSHSSRFTNTGLKEDHYMTPGNCRKYLSYLLKISDSISPARHFPVSQMTFYKDALFHLTNSMISPVVTTKKKDLHGRTKTEQQLFQDGKRKTNICFAFCLPS